MLIEVGFLVRFQIENTGIYTIVLFISLFLFGYVIFYICYYNFNGRWKIERKGFQVNDLLSLIQYFLSELLIQILFYLCLIHCTLILDYKYYK